MSEDRLTAATVKDVVDQLRARYPLTAQSPLILPVRKDSSLYSRLKDLIDSGQVEIVPASRAQIESSPLVTAKDLEQSEMWMEYQDLIDLYF